MNSIFTIIKKELKRFFTDKRMLVSLFLPGILIFIIYGFIGNIAKDSLNSTKEYTYSVYVENMPDEYYDSFKESDYEIDFVYDKNLSKDEIINLVKDEEYDLYIHFEDNFTEKVYSGEKPSVEIYYDSSSENSFFIYQYFYNALYLNSTEINYNFYINNNPNINYDLIDNENYVSIQIITMMMPFLLISLLFTGCLAITTESIAGEKERGTIATLLVTPTKRSHIALGKIIALSITSFVSAVVTSLGVILKLPDIMSVDGIDISFSMYGISTYIGIFCVIIVTIILFTTILSILSAFAKNVKEATQWGTFIMLAVILIGFVSIMMSIGSSKAANIILSILPIFNSIQCMSSIFALEFNVLTFVLTIASNAIYIAIGVYLLTKMFNSEKIMSIS